MMTSRRRFLRLTGSLALAGASLPLWAHDMAAMASGEEHPALRLAQPYKIKLAINKSAVCLAPVAVAEQQKIFSKYNLDVEFVNFGNSTDVLLEAIATGKADAGAGLIGDWLKPLEQGFDVKLFVGSHGGCLRLLAPQDSPVKTLADVGGKTISVYGLGTSPQLQFQVAIAKAGVDPDSITWKVAPFELVGEAVAKGEADLVAHLDPWAYSIQKQHNYRLIADSQTGYFENRSCCVLGANGPFLKDNTDAIRRLAAANIEVHEYTASHPDEVAAWYLENLKPAGLDQQSLTEIIGNLVTHNHPIGRELIEQVRLGAEDLKFVKVLDATTDPRELAERVTVNILA